MGNIGSWVLRLSAPRLYPIYVEWFYAKFGSDKAITSDASFVFNGIAEMTGNSSPEATSFPTGVDIVWSSLLERKWYFAEIDFSKKDLELIKSLLQTGYEGYGNKSMEEKSHRVILYDRFNVCCLPGGEIRFYFSGGRRTICLDTVFYGKETDEMDDIIVHGLRTNRSENSRYWTDVNDFFDYVLYEGKYRKEIDELKDEKSSFCEIIKSFRENGSVPFGLWNDYYQRYDYKIDVLFENQEESVPQMENVYFSNGERYSRKMLVNPNGDIRRPSPVMSIDVWWRVKDNFYFANLYFNESETFYLFKKAFDHYNGDGASLQVRISKYNNFIEVFLIGGDAVPLKFEKVEINISTSVGFHGSKEYIYSNCNWSHKNCFVGF